MDNRFRNRLSRMFRSSFGTCGLKHTSSSDAVVDCLPVFAPHSPPPQQRQVSPAVDDTSHQRYLIDLFSPRPRPFPSKPNERTKITDKNSLLDTAATGGSSSPVTPLGAFCRLKESDYQKKTRTRKKASKRSHARRRRRDPFDWDLRCKRYTWFSSSEEEEEEDDDRTTLISSKSLTSDSSESLAGKKKAAAGKQRRRMPPAGEEKEEAATMNDSMAVVKRSRDPYGDFRRSMVEMIVEKQIYDADDLENLLHCFLSLNSHHHHAVIIEVFIKICETLFCN